MQGISPPVNRSEEDFDPGALFHVAFNVEYMRFVNFLNIKMHSYVRRHCRDTEMILYSWLCCVRNVQKSELNSMLLTHVVRDRP